MKENNINQDSDNKNEEVVEKIEGNESFNNTNRSQGGTSRREETPEANDTATDGEKNDISNQETLEVEQKLVTTERVEGGYNILAKLCGNSKENTTEEKGLVQSLRVFQFKGAKRCIKSQRS